MTSNIQKALNQEKAFQSVNQENLMGLLLAAEQVRNALDQLMQSWGITRQQYNVLRILRGAGKAGLPCMQIADRMVENTPGLTRLIDRLEKKNLVSRKHGTEDRRQVLIFISKKGAALLKMQVGHDQRGARRQPEDTERHRNERTAKAAG